MYHAPLLATLVALVCGPLLYGLGQRRPALLVFLDGFVLVSVAGLVLFDVMPGSVAIGGLLSLAFLLLGAIGPVVVERGLHQARREAHLATLALAVFGLLLHSVADGAALAPGHDPHHGHEATGHALALAIIVHSIPVGLVVWWLMAPVFGWRVPAFVLAMMMLATAGGYVFGLGLEQTMGGQAFAWFQALVAGSILHVVFGRPHLEEDSGFRRTRPPFEGLGNLAALTGLFLLHSIDGHHGANNAIWHELWLYLTRLSPAFLLASIALAVVAQRGRILQASVLLGAVFLMALALLGIPLSLTWALLMLGMLVLGWQQLPRLPARGQGVLRLIHDWVTLSAPSLLLGLGLAGLIGIYWSQGDYLLPTVPWQLACAVLIPLLLGWNVLILIPLCAAADGIGVAPAAQLAMLLAAGLFSEETRLARGRRALVAAVAGAAFWYLGPERVGGPDGSVPGIIAVLMCALWAASLLASGGRKWAESLGAHSAPHAH